MTATDLELLDDLLPPWDEASACQWPLHLCDLPAAWLGRLRGCVHLPRAGKLACDVHKRRTDERFALPMVCRTCSRPLHVVWTPL
jgi:hypothetical protein